MRFIEIYDLSKIAHSINTTHIVEVSQYKDKETVIALSNGKEIYTELSRLDVLKKIDGISV